jgi:hypothetical protein
MVAPSLHGVVRPFQTSNVQPPAVQSQAVPVPATATAPPPLDLSKPSAKLEIRGSPKTFTGSYDITISYYRVKKPKEKQKT